jgi:DNA-binding NtrC family response regulator
MSERTSDNAVSILVIDDEESLRLTFQLFLQREGYGKVMTASGYTEALQCIADNDFDLIISDIVLEGTSGIDLLRLVREMGVKCPVVMVTGYPNVDTASEAVRLGAFDYISKPVDKETLLNTARLALRQYRLEQENRQFQVLLETMFRSVSDAIITLDAGLTVVAVNNAAQALLKELRPFKDVKAVTKFTDFCDSSDLCCFTREAEQVVNSGVAMHEHRVECRTADDTKKILSVCMSPFDTVRGSSGGVVIVIRDMTRLAPHRQNERRSRFHSFIGQSDTMQMVYSMIENVGRVDTTVLIAGESGTGKELAAEALHLESHRKDRPLVKVDCTAIPENLLESELFGHRRGAFTGADRDRLGRILQADSGTLFLDEIGNISTMVQLRLLRFLQEKTFYPVGSDTPIKVDVRVITATNINLRSLVEQGDFREDLYFRLRVIDIMLPPLREREGDVAQLVHHFIAGIAQKIGKEITGISDQALLQLARYSWPGNVRELEHVLERACVLCTGTTITSAQLPADISFTVPAQQDRYTMVPASRGLQPLGDQNMDNLSPESKILQALQRSGGNKAKAARYLGIDRSTLYRKIRDLQIDLSVLDL